jgi:large subunit ribosomal protein L21
MKYAVAKIGGKQLKITEGETFKIEHQDKLKFEVLAYSDGKDVFFGTPFLKDITVKATLVGEEKSKKVRVGRFKAKSRYRKTKGHRQMMSIVKIDGISKEGEADGETKKVEKAEKVEKAVAKNSVKKTTAKATAKVSKVKKEKKAE